VPSDFPARFAVGSLILLAIGSLYLIFRNGSWVYDDYFILVFARAHGFTLQWLNTPIYQHWNPAMNAGFSLLLHMFPIDYRWGLLVLLIGLGATIWILERVAALIVGSRPVSIAVACWFAFSILWTPGLQWWTVGMQTLHVFFVLLCLYGFLRFQAERRNRWIALSGGALAVGLLFYETPAFMLLYLVLVRSLLMSESLRPRTLAVTFWRERRLWTTYAAIVGVWLTHYLSVSDIGATVGHVTAVEYVRYFRIMWVETVVPAMFGLRTLVGSVSGWGLVAAIAGQLVVCALIVVSVRRSRSAWRAWTFLGIVVLTSGALVARERIAQFGVEIGSDIRYFVDFAWLAPLVFCAVFSAMQRTQRAPIGVRAAEADRAIRLPRPAIALSVALLAGYVCVSLATAATLESEWPGSQARQWYQNINRGLATLSSTRHFVVADNEVAPEIMGDFLDPLSRLSSVLPLFSSSVQVDGAIGGPLVDVDPSGVIHRAKLAAVGEGSLARLLRAKQAHISGIRRTGPGCYQASAAGGVVERTLPADLIPSNASTPYLLVDYTTSTPLSMPLYLDTGTGFPYGADELVQLSPGLSSSLAWLRYGSLHRFELRVPPLAAVCIRRIAVVTLTDGASVTHGSVA